MGIEVKVHTSLISKK